MITRAMTLALSALVSCTYVSAPKPLDASEIRQLFTSIEVGTFRPEVEEILGKPLCECPYSVGQTRDGMWRAWYVKPPAISECEAPAMHGAIEIVYNSNRVVEKTVNWQVP